MSIQGLDWARRVRTGNGTRKLVLLALADRWNADTGVCWPSVAWICDFTELGERTVRRALDELEAAGLIIHDGWFGYRADRQTKRYRLPVDNDLLTGCRNGRPPQTGCQSDLNGVPESPKRGAGAAPKPLLEPLDNQRTRKRSKQWAVDNLTRPPVPSPEETLRMLEQERT